MFTLTQSPVTFVGLLVLFGWCLVWSLRDTAVATTASQRISSILHAFMSVTMIAMVPRSWWQPLASAVGYTPIVVAFAVCTAWMLAMALWRPSWPAWGHTVMFAAMVWHLAAMRSKHAAMSAMNGGHGMNGHAMKGHEMGRHGGGMGGGMPAHGADPMAAMHHTMTTWAWIGIPLMLGLLALAVAGAIRAVSGQPERFRRAPQCHVVATSPLTVRLSGLADFAMGLGMAWMSTGLLAPVLPFMAHLHP